MGAINKAMKVGHITGVGMNTSRDLANTPANICTPSYLASTAKKLSKSFPVIKTKVLGEKEMKKMGMDCLLSVGNGSAQESKLISMNYQGGKKDERPYAINQKYRDNRPSNIAVIRAPHDQAVELASADPNKGRTVFLILIEDES